MPKSEIINDVLRFVQFGEGNSVTCIASHQVPPKIIIMISMIMMMMMTMMIMNDDDNDLHCFVPGPQSTGGEIHPAPLLLPGVFFAFSKNDQFTIFVLVSLLAFKFS